MKRFGIVWGLVFSAALVAGCRKGGGHDSDGGGDESESSAPSSGGGGSAGSGGGAAGGGPVDPPEPRATPDLTDADPAAQYASMSVVPGGRFGAGGIVRNAGLADSGAFVVEFYAMRLADVPPVPVTLGAVEVAGLPAGAEVPVDLVAAFPSVRPGVYRVGWFIDAGGRVDESDEANNSVDSLDTLLHDAWEFNDDRASAWLLGRTGGTYAVEGAMSTATDEEWFSVMQFAGRSLSVSLELLPVDCDLELYAEDGTLLASSAGAGLADESIRIPAPADGTYRIRIFSPAGEYDPDETWSLEVDVP